MMEVVTDLHIATFECNGLLKKKISMASLMGTGLNFKMQALHSEVEENELELEGVGLKAD